MPITDHEKELRLHSRHSSDFLAAVPIKKRRFVFPQSPSPPPELPSPVLADCGVSENKQESSEAGPSCSKAGGNSIKGSGVTSEVTTCESHDLPSVTSLDCGICEKKSVSRELGYNFQKIGGNPVQLNIVMGKVASFESHESSSSSPVDCHITEKKPDSSETATPFSTSGCNLVQVSCLPGEHTCEPCDLPSPTPSGCDISEKKPEYSEEPESPFLSTGGNPSQVNYVAGKHASGESCEEPRSRDLKICPTLEILPRFNQGSGSNLAANFLDVTGYEQGMVLNNEFAAWPGIGSAAIPSATKPCDLPSPTPSGCDISEKKPEYSAEPESPFLSAGGNPAQVNSVAGELASGESCEEPKSRELNICPTLEMLPKFNQGPGLNLAANFMDVTSNEQGLILNNEFAAWPGIGSAAIPSTTKQTFEPPGREGNFKGRFSLSEGDSVKQEGVGLQNIQSIVSDTQHKADSSHLCLNRSNWDLNTTMDAWEGSSSADSLLNSGSADNRLRDGGGVQNTNLELGFKQNVLNKPREADELLRNYNLQKNLKFPNMSASMIDSNLETCLDLQLKPSFLSNSCNTSGKNDAISELPLLNLGTQPVLAVSDPPLSLGRTVKSEPIERDQKDTGKQIKSESCEEKEISKTTISANIYLECSRALKTEPLEEQSQGYARSHEGISFHIGQKSQSFVSQSKPMDQNANDNDSKTLDVASEHLDLNSVLHPCTSRPNINIFNNSSDVVANVPNLVNQDPMPGNDISTTTATIQDPIGIHTEHSALVSKSHVSDGNDINSLPEACETSSLPRASLPENLNNNGEGNDNSEGAPELLVQMEPSNSHPSSNVTLTDEVIQNPCENIKVVKSAEVEGKVGAEEPCESTINTIHKRCGQDEEDYKDGEMRYPVLNGTVEGSSLVKAADSISPVDVPVSIPFVAGSSEEANAVSPKENDGNLNESKVHSNSSLAIGVLTTESDNRIVRKIILRNRKDQPEDDKGLEKISKSSDLVTKTILPDNQKQNAEGLSLARNYDSCKIDPLEKKGATKGANDRGNNRRIIYLNSAPNCLAVGNKKSTLDRSISSRGARERPFNRIFRDESINERSRKAENERHYGHQIENRWSDSLCIRRRADRSANHDDVLEQRNNSARTRYSPEFSDRQTRKLKNEEMQNQSRLPYQRRSPGSRLQIPLGGHAIRDVSPRCIRRDVPDFVLLGHQDSQYERDEGVLLRRERRSLSPPLRRGGPLHLPPNCTRSLQQQRSIHQWSPPRRSSDGFNGPQELVRLGSPQIRRLNRLQSPHEEMIVRRRGSLNYDIVDVGPSREQNFTRLIRGSNRNTRRFDMIDPREIAEEEYFDPRAVDNRILEFGADDEFVEDRGYNERRQPIRESFRFHDEDGPNPRALGFNPDANEGREPRDFDARFRNRLGNSSGRFRGSVEEQEGNYRLHEEQEWRDATYNDTRTKRRRF